MSDCGANFSSSSSNAIAACISAEQFEQGLEFSASIAGVKPLKSFLIQLDEVKFDGTTFWLSAPILATVYVEDGTWYCENKEFSSLAFGSTAEQAVHSFCEDFSVLWDEIAQAQDETLTADAQRIKRALLSAVKTVETELIRCR
jgi:hypothetical protein